MQGACKGEIEPPHLVKVLVRKVSKIIDEDPEAHQVSLLQHPHI